LEYFGEKQLEGQVVEIVEPVERRGGKKDVRTGNEKVQNQT